MFASAWIVWTLFICYSLSSSADMAKILVGPRKLTAVKKFVESNGGYIYPGLELKKTPESGWSTFFGSDTPDEIYSDDIKTIFKIPFDLIICNTSDSRTLYVEFLHQLHERWSFFEPYFMSLPSTDVDLLWHWKDEELLRLENEYLMKDIIAQRAEKTEIYKQLTASLPYNISFTDFQLIDFWIESRTFNVEEWYCMVPFADLPNHSHDSPPTIWLWEIDDKGNRFFTMRTRATVRRGQEFTIPYTIQMSNENSLKDYGFADVNGRNQRTDLHYSVDTGNVEAKRSKIDHVVLSYEADVYWTMRFFRTYVATDQELRVHSFDQPLSLVREMDAAKACVRVIRSILPKQTLLHREFRYHYDLKISSREKKALAYKISYDRVYERTAHFCELLSEHLQCIAWRKLKFLWSSQPILSIKLEKMIRSLYKGGTGALCR